MPRRRTAPSPPPDLPSSSAAEDDSSDDDDEPIIPLLAGREKRFNAGNRMRALLEDEQQGGDHQQVEEMFQEEEGDDEFEGKEEADVFDSDFGSTDSGSGGEEEQGEDAGERQLQREAKEARREARGKKKKATRTPFVPSFARQTKAAQAQAHARASTSATTLDEDGSPGPPARKRRKKELDPGFLVPQRESSRKSAVAFKKTIEERLKDSEQKRASAPKPKAKPTIHLTQADLISEALETEEINRASLLAFYAAEEDRRALERAAGMRYEIWGPKVTFLSRLEGLPEDYRVGVGKGKEKGKGREVEGGEADGESGRRRLIEVIGEAGKVGWNEGVEVGRKAAQEAREREAAGGAAAAAAGEGEGEGSSLAAPAPSMPIVAVGKIDLSHPLSRMATAAEEEPAGAVGGVKPRPAAGSIPGYTRNYLIIDELEDATRGEEMEALFGGHVDWEKEVVEVEPEARHPLCPLTSLPARYRHPSSHTPYATIAAYRTLHRVIAGEFIFSPTLWAFTGREGEGLVGSVEGARAVPGGAGAGAGRRSAGMMMGRGTSGQGQGHAVQLALWEAKREHEREVAAAGGGLPPLPVLPGEQWGEGQGQGQGQDLYARGYGGGSRTRKSRGGEEE